MWEPQIQVVLHAVQIGSVGHSASYPKGLWGFFPRVKAFIQISSGAQPANYQNGLLGALSPGVQLSSPHYPDQFWGPASQLSKVIVGDFSPGVIYFNFFF
jgi:hypothetical protein